MRSPNNELTVGQAFALGTLQGPAELLPISSSAHTAAVPWLLGWRYGELDGELRKSFEVALHAGTALALVIARGDALGPLDALEPVDPLSRSVIGLACLPPAIAGYLFEQPIERRLGTPETIVLGLLAGSVAMALADHRPGERHVRDAGIPDGLWLGLAQAAALIPGVSRSGATLSTARLLGFERDDARRLSTRVGLPVLAGATLLKGFRLCRRGLEPGWVAVFAAGVGGSFASSFAVARRSRPPERLLPYAIYRAVLASWILVRLRRGSTARRPGRSLP